MEEVNEMIEAFILDMDGVISDTEIVGKKADILTFEKYGIRMKESDLDKYTGTNVREFLYDVVKKCGKKISLEEIIKRHRKIWMGLLEKELKEMNGSINLIIILSKKGYPLAVASSSPKDIINYILMKLNIAQYFQVIVSGDEVTYGKPNPEIFLTVAKRLGKEPQNCVVIEDSRNGVIAAKAAGMFCIGLQNKNSGDQDLTTADIIVDSMEQINVGLVGE